MLVGYCKECGSEVRDNDKLPDWNIYECSNCGHPNSECDLWDEVPDYINKDDEEITIELSIQNSGH